MKTSAPWLSKTNFKSAVISYKIFFKEYQEALWINNPQEHEFLNFDQVKRILKTLHMLDSWKEEDEA